MTKIVLPFLLALLVNYVQAQINHYISPTGSDANNGLLATPWKTIQHAVTSSANYDTLNIMAGTYNEKININRSNIYVRGYNGSKPLVSGTGITAQVAMMQIIDQSNITIDGLEVANNAQKDAQGILTDGNCQNITIKNCTLHDIHFSSNPNAKVTSSTNAQGIIVYGSDGNNTIRNLKIMNDTIYNCRLGYSEAVSVDGNIDGFEVSGNLVHDVTNIGIDAEGHYGVSPNAANDQARNGVIKNNTTYNCLSPYATSGGLYIDGAKNIVLENNTSYHNGYGIEVGCETKGTATDSIIVRNNIFYNNQICAIALGGYDYPSGSGKVTNSSVTNNTCYKNNYTNSGNGEFYLSYSEHTLIENNIFYLSAQNILTYTELGQVSLNFNYNLFYSDNDTANIGVDWNGTYYSTLAAFKTATGTNTNSIIGNPKFIKADTTNPDFHIAVSSAAKNAGNPSFTAATTERDIDNQDRVSGIVDCGADEYYASVVYTFIGNGDWSDTANWSNNTVPPAILPANATIIIDPIVTGKCNLNVIQHIASGASIIVSTGKNFKVLGELKIQ